jgi:AcrR family transcriptional regulator
VVYSQFTGTDDMLRASLDREEQRALAQIADAVPGPAAQDVPVAFHSFFDTYLRAVADAPQRWRAIFMIADSGTPAFHQRVNRARARFVREFEAALPDSGIVGHPADPELAAHYLLAVLWESGRLLLVSPDEFTHQRLLRSLDALLTAMLAHQ